MTIIKTDFEIVQFKQCTFAKIKNNTFKNRLFWKDVLFGPLTAKVH
jgi:hypothetical protein